MGGRAPRNARNVTALLQVVDGTGPGQAKRCGGIGIDITRTAQRVPFFGRGLARAFRSGLAVSD